MRTSRLTGITFLSAALFFLSPMPAAAQNIIIKGTFTAADGALLQNHNPDFGSAHSWQKGSSPDLVLQRQRAQNSGLGRFAVYSTSSSPPRADLLRRRGP